MNYNVKRTGTKPWMIPGYNAYRPKEYSIPLEDVWHANVDISTQANKAWGIAFHPYYTETCYVHGIVVYLGKEVIGLGEMGTRNWYGRERFVWELVIEKALKSIKDPELQHCARVCAKHIDWENYDLYSEKIM